MASSVSLVTRVRRAVRAFGTNEQSQRTRTVFRREARTPVASSYHESLDYSQMMRFAEHESDIVAAALAIIETEIVGGSAIVPAPNAVDFAGVPVDLLNARLGQLYEDWSANPLADQSAAESQAQRLAVRLWWRDGEVFLWLHDDGAYSILESTDVSYGSDSRRRVIAGVEVDAQWRPVAYWLDPGQSSEQAHPYSVSKTYSSVASLANAERLPAARILHLAHITRPRQLRGVSPFRAVLNRLRGLGEYELSELDAARIASYAAFYIRRNDGGGAQDAAQAVAGELDLEPGLSFPDLGPGEEVGSVNVDRPNSALPDFRSAMLRAVAAGLGISYESLARQHDSSYSASRAAGLQSTESMRMHRRAFIQRLEAAKYRWLVRYWQSAGMLELPGMVDVASVYRPEWPQKPVPQIDPQKEMRAHQLALEAGIESREGIIRSRGRDPRRVETERMREQSENE